MSLLPTQKSVLENIGDPRVLEMLAKDPRWAPQVNAYLAAQSSGGDMYYGAQPDWTGLEGYNYTAGGDQSGDKGTLQNYALYDPTGKQAGTYDYVSEGAGMSPIAGIAGVLGAAFGLPYLAGTMGGAGAAAGGAGGAVGGASGAAGALGNITGTGALGAEAGAAVAADMGLTGGGLFGGDLMAGLAGPAGGLSGLSTGGLSTGLTAGLPAGAAAGFGGFENLINGVAPAAAVSPISSAWKSLPSPVQNLLTSKAGGALIGGLLGKALTPSQGGGTGMTPYKGTPMQTPQFTAPTLTPSQGMPNGLGSQSAGLFDKYMQDLLMQQGPRATTPRPPERGPGTY